jgi:diguanylate cyclase (GGDEF)-like protein
VQELAKLNRALEVEVRVRRHAEEMLRNLAHHDSLTGLPNRTLLKDRFESALASAQRREHSLAILLLDLDNLKTVNDTYGHDAGDDLLIAVANALKSLVRGMDTVARTGGDEFVILLTDIQDGYGAQEVARKVIKRFEEPILTDKGEALRTSTSIGIAFYPQDGLDIGTLIKHADQAMYRAKMAGKNTFRLYAEVV